MKKTYKKAFMNGLHQETRLMMTKENMEKVQHVIKRVKNIEDLLILEKKSNLHLKPKSVDDQIKQYTPLEKTPTTSNTQKPPQINLHKIENLTR